MNFTNINIDKIQFVVRMNNIIVKQSGIYYKVPSFKAAEDNRSESVDNIQLQSFKCDM